MAEKFYTKGKWVPRRARSKRLREAGLTGADVKRHVRSSVGDDISALWLQSEDNRRYYDVVVSQYNYELQQATNEIAVIKGNTQTLTAAEVAGIVNNILKSNS